MIQKSTPDFNDLMRMAQNAIFSRLNCHGIGKILDTAFVWTKLPVLSEFRAHKAPKEAPKIKARRVPSVPLNPSYI